MSEISLRKTFLCCFVVGFSKVISADLVSLSDEEARSATAQASIEVDASLYVKVEALTAEDDLNSGSRNDVGGGTLRLEGFELGYNLENTERLDFNLQIDVVPVAGLAADIPAVALAEGDVLRQRVSDVQADVKIAAIRSGEDSSTPSFGQLFVDELNIDESVTYLYSIQDSNSIGLDTTLNMSIERLEYTDAEPEPETSVLANPVGGGSLALNDVKLSELNLYGTRLGSVSSSENPFEDSPALRLTLPSIESGFLSIGGVQIGSEDDWRSRKFYQQQAFGITLSGIQNDASTVYLYTPAAGDGIRFAQSINMKVDELAITSPTLSPEVVVRRALVQDIAAAQIALQNHRKERGYDDDGNPAAGVDVLYDSLFNSLTGLERELSGLDDVDTAALEIRAEELNTAYKESKESSGGSIRLRGITAQTDESVVAIDIDADDKLVISAPLLNGRFSVEGIYIGANSLGSLSFEDVNIPVNTLRISGKE